MEYSGLLFNIDEIKNIQVFVDVSFAKDWKNSWIQDPSLVYLWGSWNIRAQILTVGIGNYH